jgi:tetratricopeptide (TPR) repeat protein
MVMKFVNQTLASICVVSLLLISGCAGKVQLPEAGQKVALKSTSQYIPKKSFVDGKEQPYEATENPYLNIRSKVNKGSVLLFIEAKKAKRNGKLELAKQKLGVITKKDESLSGPWSMLGDIAIEEKQFKLAASHYKKSIEITRDNVNAYTGLAKAQRLMGEYNVAQNTLEAALQLWPDFPEAHLNLGILYDIYLNKPKQAQMHMEAYLYLTDYKNKLAETWLEEVRSRTGITASFIVDQASAVKVTSSTAGSSEVKK